MIHVLEQFGWQPVRTSWWIQDQDLGTDQLADVEPDRTQGSAKDLASDVMVLALLVR